MPESVAKVTVDVLTIVSVSAATNVLAAAVPVDVIAVIRVFSAAFVHGTARLVTGVAVIVNERDVAPLELATVVGIAKQSVILPVNPMGAPAIAFTAPPAVPSVTIGTVNTKWPERLYPPSATRFVNAISMRHETEPLPSMAIATTTSLAELLTVSIPAVDETLSASPAEIAAAVTQHFE
jgi:hypothetical protein